MCFWFFVPLISRKFASAARASPVTAGTSCLSRVMTSFALSASVAKRAAISVWPTASCDRTDSPGPRRRALLLPLVRKSAGLLMRVTPPTRAMDSSLTGVPALTANVISIRVGSAADGRTDATCPTRMPANNTGVPVGDAAGVAQVRGVDHLSTHVLRCAHGIHRRAEDQQADDDEDADSGFKTHGESVRRKAAANPSAASRGAGSGFRSRNWRTRG